MATTDDIYREVMNLKGDMQAVKHQTSWMLRSHAEDVARHWKDLFGIKPSAKRNYSKMRVYLATNGRRSVTEVAAVANVDVSDASKWLAEMDKGKIVYLLPVAKSTRIYDKTPADFSLGISEQLEQELIKQNGRKEGASK